MPEREQVVGIEIGKAHKAYPIAVPRQQKVVNDRVGTTPVVVVHSAPANMTMAFSRAVRGRTLTFQTSGNLEITDKETGSTWTPFGECMSGQLKGTKLPRITPLPSFWFSWVQFFPDTELFTAK